MLRRLIQGRLVSAVVSRCFTQSSPLLRSAAVCTSAKPNQLSIVIQNNEWASLGVAVRTLHATARCDKANKGQKGRQQRGAEESDDSDLEEAEGDAEELEKDELYYDAYYDEDVKFSPTFKDIRCTMQNARADRVLSTAFKLSRR